MKERMLLWLKKSRTKTNTWPLHYKFGLRRCRARPIDRKRDSTKVLFGDYQLLRENPRMLVVWSLMKLFKMPMQNWEQTCQRLISWWLIYYQSLILNLPVLMKFLESKNLGTYRIPDPILAGACRYESKWLPMWRKKFQKLGIYWKRRNETNWALAVL